MPWIHFHVGDRGNVKACCVANIPYGNVNQDNYKAIWEGDAITTIREKFARGKADPRCAVCLNREKAGAKSIRQETFEKFEGRTDFKQPRPIYFDIRFSNVCNFRCRTCWHGASSKWFQDAKALGRNLGDKAILKNIADFELFIAEYGDALLHAREIYFAGGEPLVTEAHYLLLEWLIDKGLTPNLRYNTNFSVLRFKQWNVLELWRHFPTVEVLASVDASENLGAYIRKEFNWDLFLSNRQAIRAYGHIQFKMAPTVSVLNMAHLPQFYEQCTRLEVVAPTEWYLNLVERPYYYNIQSFLPAEKSAIDTLYASFFQTVQLPAEVRRQFEDCLRFMHGTDRSTHRKAFWKETRVLDALRNENQPDNLFGIPPIS